MPIIDYEAAANKSLQRLLDDPDISDKNKQYINSFDNSYSVSAARRNLFYTHIKRYLKLHPDIKEFASDTESVNKAFAGFRKELGVSLYATLINVSKMYARWLNDGELPRGFKDVRTPPKKQQKRKLEPEDMLTWEEGQALAAATNSVQIKAAILTQLDAGLRPSEFIDLQYGDVKHNNHFLILRVREGKTGSRDVIVYHAVPYLLKWLEAHPTKKNNAPLWVKESGDKVEAYKYPALLQRIRKLAAKTGLKKPLYLYNFRHSAVTLSKKDNIPTDEGANKFGHSVQHYTDTYGRLDITERANRLAAVYGLEEEHAQKRSLNQVCERCGNENTPEAVHCSKCGTPLTLEQANKERTEQEEVLNQLIEEKIKQAVLHLGQQETARRIFVGEDL